MLAFRWALHLGMLGEFPLETFSPGMLYSRIKLQSKWSMTQKMFPSFCPFPKWSFVHKANDLGFLLCGADVHEARANSNQDESCSS